jgi:hypothetical protein
MPERQSPLDAAHRALGAKMVPFSGWEVPLSYPTGTLAEHRTCRTGAVVFDVSHLGTVRLSGPGAYDVLQRTLTNDLSKIESASASSPATTSPPRHATRADLSGHGAALFGARHPLPFRRHTGIRFTGGRR